MATVRASRPFLDDDVVADRRIDDPGTGAGRPAEVQLQRAGRRPEPPIASGARSTTGSCRRGSPSAGPAAFRWSPERVATAPTACVFGRPSPQFDAQPTVAASRRRPCRSSRGGPDRRWPSREGPRRRRCRSPRRRPRGSPGDPRPSRRSAPRRSSPPRRRSCREGAGSAAGGRCCRAAATRRCARSRRTRPARRRWSKSSATIPKPSRLKEGWPKPVDGGHVLEHQARSRSWHCGKGVFVSTSKLVTARDRGRRRRSKSAAANPIPASGRPFRLTAAPDIRD